jgi:hypothetical protein
MAAAAFRTPLIITLVVVITLVVLWALNRP